MKREFEPLEPLMPLVSERPCCDGCGASAPETNTDYTLISRSFGWRLTRRKLPSGALTMEWRCASCWKKYKGERDIVPSATIPTPVISATPRSSRPPARTLPPAPYAIRVSKLVGGLR